MWRGASKSCNLKCGPTITYASSSGRGAPQLDCPEERNMIREMTLAGVITALSALLAPAETWTIDQAHSSAQFAVRHMMISTVRGDFSKLTGKVEYDPAKPGATKIDATIDVASIDTRVPARDNHLKGADFFDVAKYPTMSFVSKSVEPAGSGKLKVIGDLTLHGVTKQVVLDVDGPSGVIKNRQGSKMGATATTKISRKDFGLTWNQMLEAGGVAVSDEVNITLDLELSHQ
jgi:polyisoprenoid-binding protein YceI